MTRSNMNSENVQWGIINAISSQGSEFSFKVVDPGGELVPGRQCQAERRQRRLSRQIDDLGRRWRIPVVKRRVDLESHRLLLLPICRSSSGARWRQRVGRAHGRRRRHAWRRNHSECWCCRGARRRWSGHCLRRMDRRQRVLVPRQAVERLLQRVTAHRRIERASRCGSALAK